MKEITSAIELTYKKRKREKYKMLAQNLIQ